MQLDAEGKNWRELYPFSSKCFEVGHDRARMHYVDEGSGPPLVMVHGNPTWSFYYRQLIEAFRSNYRTIAVDHIGCGLSDKPERYNYTLAQRIADLDQLITSLELDRITMIVHDWGGAIGLGVAEIKPARIARLVILNTGAFPPPYVPLRIRLCRTPLLGTIAMRRYNLFARAALRMATEKPKRFTADVRAGYLAPYDSWANRVAIDAFVRDIPFTSLHPTWETLKRIEMGLPFLANRPTQILWGLKDWCFTQACLDRFKAVFKNAEVHEFADAGHYVLEDAYERVIPAISDFLKRTDEY